MNFLAHCALADSDPRLLVGGFLGDFVKGTIPSNLPERVQLGVRLHRRLDAFSAVEPDIKTSVLRLPSDARRVGGVFVDLITDHFLARAFDRLHGEPLTDFTARTYRTLYAHEHLLPSDARGFLDYASEHDLFAGYVDRAPIERAFARICRRLDRSELTAPCMAAFDADYAQFEGDFGRYYPALRAHASEWIARHYA